MDFDMLVYANLFNGLKYFNRALPLLEKRATQYLCIIVMLKLKQYPFFQKQALTMCLQAGSRIGLSFSYSFLSGHHNGGAL